MTKGLIISCLLLLQITLMAAERDSIVVTHIANCGFLIEMDASKMIIDGIFTEGFNAYATPDSIVLNKMIHGVEPFDNIDYVFVTHVHSDHYDPGLMANFLMNNQQSKLIGPNQVIQELKRQTDQFANIESRVLKCTPDTFWSMPENLDGVQVKGYRLAHMNEKCRDIENIAYAITVHNKTIFHTGDADPNPTEIFSGEQPSANRITLAFINGAFAYYKNFQVTNSFIGADQNVAMHFPKDFFTMKHEKITDVPDYYTEPVVFQESMERKVFYLLRP